MDNNIPEDSLAIVPRVGTPEEALATAYGLTGIPDIKEGYNALNRGEYLQAIGHGAAGLAALAPMAKMPMAAAAGIFGGARALAAPVMDFAMQYAPKTLANALTMGRTTGSREIFEDTGWFVGPDAKWRFTIPDDQAGLRVENQLDARRIIGNPRAKLPDLLDHPELYEQYPFLKKVGINADVPGNSAGAAYQTSMGDHFISLNPKLDPNTNLLPTLLHEVQHVVQNYEGHAAGGSPQQFLPTGFQADYDAARSSWMNIEKQIESAGSFPVVIRKGITQIHQGNDPGPVFEAAWNKLPQPLRDRTLDAAGNLMGHEMRYRQANTNYMNLAGEVESRTVEEQLAQRDWSRPPWEYEGYTPFGQQLVTFGQRGGKAALIPVEHDPFGVK